MLHFLGIDDATASGHALRSAERGAEPLIVASGVLHLSSMESYSRQIYRVLRGLPVAPNHAAVEMPVPYYEDGHLRNFKGFLTQCGILALWTDAIFEVYKIRPKIVAPSKWQSPLHKGAFGKSTKSKSFNFCLRKWGYTPADDNEADALCIAFWLHTRYSFCPVIDPKDPKAGTLRALAANIARNGGDPMMFQILEERRKKK
jgi:hypothetical protein